MLEMKLDIVPWGMEEQRTRISSITITNDGTGGNDFGNYDYSILLDNEMRWGSIDHFDRSRGALELLTEVLLDAQQ